MQIGWGKLMANFHPNHKLFLRKCLYKETIPENMADPQIKSGKLRKSAELLPFIEGNRFTMFQTIFLSGSLTKE